MALHLRDLIHNVCDDCQKTGEKAKAEPKSFPDHDLEQHKDTAHLQGSQTQ